MDTNIWGITAKFFDITMSGVTADFDFNRVRRNGTNGTGGSKHRPFPNSTASKQSLCYTCDIACVYKSIEMVYVIGVIANLLVITCVARDKRLRKPTYITLACLALADAFFLAANLTISINVVLRAFLCSSLNLNSELFGIFVGTCWCSANGHLTLISAVRYLLIVHPLKAQLHLTIRRVLLISCLIWVISGSVYGIRFLLYDQRVIPRSKSEETVLIIWFISYLLPFVFTTISHVAKINTVRQATKHNSSAFRQATVDRMSKMIIVILALAFILPIPKLCVALLKKSGYVYPSRTFRLHFQNISIFLFLLTSAINPVIYAFMSPVFRRSLVLLFSCTTASDRSHSIVTLRSSLQTHTPSSSPKVRAKQKQTHKPSSAESTPEMPRSDRETAKPVCLARQHVVMGSSQSLSINAK